MEPDTSTDEGSFSKADDIFFNAVEITILDERNIFLEKACAGDQALRHQVDSLIASHDASNDFFENPLHLMIPARDFVEIITDHLKDLEKTITDIS